MGALGFAAPVGAGDDETNTSEDGGSSSDSPSNVEVLNYALTLEHLEDTFYRQGLQEFSDSELQNAEVLCERNERQVEEVPERLHSVSKHESDHVETISQVIEQLGGDPVEAACYDFGYETPSEFIQLGAVFENTGVAAYNGAIHFFDNDDLATAAATVATVEGRHASYFNEIVPGGDSPFPRSFDQAKSMSEIRSAISDFIVECE